MLESSKEEPQLSSKDLKLRPELLQETTFLEEVELESQPLPIKLNLFLILLEVNMSLEPNLVSTLLEPNQVPNTFLEDNTLPVLPMETVELLMVLLVLLIPPATPLNILLDMLAQATSLLLTPPLLEDM
jgi:hypothetical protein